MDSDCYRTIKSVTNGIYKDKGSRFVSLASPFSNQDEAKAIIDKIRKEHHSARHHCYAYMLGQARDTWRVNDDGEPSGTAGKPILGQINSFGLTNIIIIVSRYFGGTLLGVSGLINAYKSAAADSIANSEIIERTVQEYYEILFPYSAMNDVMTILKEEAAEQSEQSFELECRMILNFRSTLCKKIMNRLSRVEGLKSNYLKTV